MLHLDLKKKCKNVFEWIRGLFYLNCSELVNDVKLASDLDSFQYQPFQAGFESEPAS